MERETANEVLACLPQERTPYHYYRDYYAVQLLGYVAGEGVPVGALRAGPFARLLNKPPVRRVLAQCGDGHLHRAHLQAYWERDALPFLLTLGLWGGDGWGWRQTSRPGYNLVLRLNFSRDHDRRFRRLFVPCHGDTTLNPWSSHPVLRRKERPYFRETLAWSRLDVDLARGEALIEEIQTDWVREAREVREHLERQTSACPEDAHKAEAARRYLDQVLAPYARLWDEAMLSAAIHFLREELGIGCIWYHTWSSGNALKGIGKWGGPPRSLYTQLPRRFCFGETEALPEFLRNRRTDRRLRKARVSPRFFQLRL